MWAEPVPLTTLLLFLATAALALYTWDLVKDGRAVSEKQLRPYLWVGVTEAIGTPLANGGLRVEVVPSIGVYGQTPAGGVDPM